VRSLPAWPVAMTRATAQTDAVVEDRRTGSTLSAPKTRLGSATNEAMGVVVDRSHLPAAATELEDSVARLCWIASAAHACGDYPRRDDAVDLAAELARGLAEQPVT